MLNTTTVNIEKVSSVSTFEIRNDSQHRKKKKIMSLNENNQPPN